MPRYRVIIGCIAAAVLLGAAACGDDDEDVPAGGDDDATTEADTDGPADEAEPAGGPITIEDLEDRCDELADIAADLRGEEPEQVETGSTPPGPTGVMVGDDVGYETAHCAYGWGDDSFSDPNRITFQIDRPLEDEVSQDVRNNIWDALAFDSEPEGVGDEARFHHGVTFDAQSVLHVLVGDTVVRVRVQVPDDLEDEPYLEEDNVVAAAEELLTRLDV